MPKIVLPVEPVITPASTKALIKSVLPVSDATVPPLGSIPAFFAATAIAVVSAILPDASVTRYGSYMFAADGVINKSYDTSYMCSPVPSESQINFVAFREFWYFWVAAVNSLLTDSLSSAICVDCNSHWVFRAVMAKNLACDAANPICVTFAFQLT